MALRIARATARRRRTRAQAPECGPATTPCVAGTQPLYSIRKILRHHIRVLLQSILDGCMQYHVYIIEDQRQRIS